MILRNQLARPAGVAQGHEINTIANFRHPSGVTENCGVPCQLASTWLIA